MTNANVNRREFAKRLTLGATAAVVGTDALTLADEPQQARKQAEAVKPRDEPADADDDADHAVEDALLEVVRRRYPDRRLQPGVLEAIRQEIRSDLRRGETLREFALKNSDEPAFVFSAFRSDAIR